MSILIKGMGMPDSCFHCKLAEVCQHYKAEHYANKRHEDCPLEEVQETHDKRTETHTCDLIERKKAIEVIDGVFPVDPMKSEYAQGIACGAALAKTYVEQLPSAELATDCISRQDAIDERSGA